MTIAFLFKSGRKPRLNTDGPGEFFYGYRELARDLPGCALIEDAGLDIRAGTGLLARLGQRLANVLLRVHPAVVVGLQRHRRQLNGFDVLVATTTSHGFALGLLSRLGVIRSRVAFIAMGIIRPDEGRRRLAYLGWLLARLHVVCISRGEEAELRRRLGGGVRISYLPFGVDARYWTPAPPAKDPPAPYVLSIGNDPQRDFATLVAAWQPDFPILKIVTRLPLPTPLPANVEAIPGDWNAMTLSDEAVRELYRGARFVVLPIRQTLQPSGQSACLQAMACGRAVILSDIQGLWDRALMVHDQSLLLVPPGDAAALARAAARLAGDDALAARLGAAGRAVVEKHLNLDAMAAALGQMLAQPEEKA